MIGESCAFGAENANIFYTILKLQPDENILCHSLAGKYGKI
jgi:hypothetical protein